MIDEYVRSELLRKFDLLSPGLQHQVLDYADSLVKEVGAPRRIFLRYREYSIRSRRKK